jgi:hypothetical protein
MNLGKKKKRLWPVFTSSIAPYLISEEKVDELGKRKVNDPLIEKRLKGMDLDKEYEKIKNKTSTLSSINRKLVIFKYENKLKEEKKNV